MATWYWNGATDSNWSNLLNWWDNADSNGEVHPSTAPWTTIDTAEDNLESCATVVIPPFIEFNNIGDDGSRTPEEPVERWYITGVCNIDSISLSTSIFDGTFYGNDIVVNNEVEGGHALGQISGGAFTGNGLTNNGMIWGGTFGGTGFINNGDIYGGTFEGQILTNNKSIFGGAFIMESFVNSTFNGVIYGGAFSCLSFECHGTIYGGIFSCTSFLRDSGPSGGFWLSKGNIKLTDWKGNTFLVRGTENEEILYSPETGGFTRIEGTDLLGTGML